MNIWVAVWAFTAFPQTWLLSLLSPLRTVGISRGESWLSWPVEPRRGDTQAAVVHTFSPGSVFFLLIHSSGVSKFSQKGPGGIFAFHADTSIIVGEELDPVVFSALESWKPKDY